MIHAYCIVRPGDPPPSDALRGHGGRPVRLLELRGLGVWISDGEPIQPELSAVRDHDAVVRAALRSATPLPLRFGTTYPDEAALRHALAGAEEELISALERVEGRVEMGVRVEWDRGDAGPLAEGQVAGGRAYLERRRQEMRALERLRSEAGALLDQIESRLVQEGEDGVRTLLPEPGVAGSMAHLVQRHMVGTYRSRVEEVQEDLSDVRLRVSGPWAPYSFV